VPFFVAVFREVYPDGLDHVMSAVRGDLAASRRLHPGRRDARIFQRLNTPTDLLEIAEWDRQADYEQIRYAARCRAPDQEAVPSTRTEYLTRLRLFARMSAPAVIVGCTMLTAPPEHADALGTFVLGEVPHGDDAPPGLVTHEVYRVGAEDRRFLVVHGWRTLEDLERYRAANRARYVETYQALDATADRFTGVVAAELSRLESRGKLRSLGAPSL